MIKIGVLGAGYLGRIHIGLIKEIADFEMVGFYDPNQEKVDWVEKEFGVRPFTSTERLIDEVDAIDIVTPTISHFECAVSALRKSKHIFIEKPITNTGSEAVELRKLVHEANVKVQVGHVERFNPAYRAILPYLNVPMFIEAQRLGPYNPRGTDVPVVLDLMIHDIDLVMNMVKSPIRKIMANGIPVVSNTPDIASARLEFNNGSVANLTASRVSLDKVRKTKIFQRDAYISLDFLNKDAKIYRLNKKAFLSNHFDSTSNTLDLQNTNGISIETPVVTKTNAIKDELRDFARSIIENHQPLVSIDDGCDALLVAQKIVRIMDSLPV